MPQVSQSLVMPSDVIKMEMHREHRYSGSSTEVVDISGLTGAARCGTVLVLDVDNKKWVAPVTGEVDATTRVGIVADTVIYDLQDWKSLTPVSQNVLKDRCVVVDKFAIAAEFHLDFDAGLSAADITQLKANLETQGVELALSINDQDGTLKV